MLDFIAGLIPQFLLDFWATWPPVMQYLATTLFKILILTIGVILCVAFSTYFERKVIGSMQARVGPTLLEFEASQLKPLAAQPQPRITTERHATRCLGSDHDRLLLGASS